MDAGWLSNAYLVYDEPGGTALFVDSGAPLEPLLEVGERERLTPTHVLRTHAHSDHVAHEAELGLPVVIESLDETVDPPKAQRLTCGVLERHRLPPRVVLVEHEPDSGT